MGMGKESQTLANALGILAVSQMHVLSTFHPQVFAFALPSAQKVPSPDNLMAHPLFKDHFFTEAFPGTLASIAPWAVVIPFP